MPACTARFACARLMAGPWVISAVPAPTRRSTAPGTEVSIPISTANTSARAAPAIRLILAVPSTMLFATSAVTSLPDWLTPCRTTP